MPLAAYINFCFKNYLREHRYLLDLVGMVIFTIFFGAFLNMNRLEDGIWIVFAAFIMIVNMMTAYSVFFFERGNTLTFLISKPNGRRNLFTAKVIVTVLIDLVWVGAFAIIYGLKFLSPIYFALLPIRLLFIAILLLLSTLLIGISYTFRPQIAWLLLLLFVFGVIVPKEAMLQFDSLLSLAKSWVVLLPPFQELIFLSAYIQIHFGPWQWFFLAISLLQIAALYRLNMNRFRFKDMI